MTIHPDYVNISLREYAQLVGDQEWLHCLESAGVDNWEGYEEALRIHQELQGYDEE